MKTTREKLLKWLHTKDGWRWLQENYYPESVKPTMKTTREQAKKEFSNKKGRAYIPKNESELYWSLVEFGYPHPEAIEISRKYHKFIEHLLEKSCTQHVKNTDTLAMSKAEWIDELKSVFAKAKKEQRAIFPNVVMFIEDLLDKEREEVVKRIEEVGKLDYTKEMPEWAGDTGLPDVFNAGVELGLKKVLSTLKPKNNPTKKQSADYVKRNFGEVIKRLAKE